MKGRKESGNAASLWSCEREKGRDSKSFMSRGGKEGGKKEAFSVKTRTLERELLQRLPW